MALGGSAGLPALLLSMSMGMLLGISLALSGDDKVAVLGLIIAGMTTGITLICGLVRQWWRATEPGRTYEITFMPPTVDRERKSCEATRDDAKIIELYVKVRAKKPVVASTHSFRLTTRQLSARPNRLWQFKCAPTNEVWGCRLWDARSEAEAARQKKENGGWAFVPQPTLREDGVGVWVADYGMKGAVTEDTFLYRVIIEMRLTEIWRGFLQFTATGRDGRVSRTQRGVTLWP